SWFAKADDMHGVPPPMTGNYMPSLIHVEIDESQFSYGQKQSNTIETPSESFETCVTNGDDSTRPNLTTPVGRPKPVSAGRPKLVSAGRAKPVPPGRSKPVSAGRPKPVFASRPKPVSAGRSKPVPAGRPKLVPTCRQNARLQRRVRVLAHKAKAILTLSLDCLIRQPNEVEVTPN
nr:hypothetical protein [Tanacetum cinerariifolium]